METHIRQKPAITMSVHAIPMYGAMSKSIFLYFGAHFIKNMSMKVQFPKWCSLADSNCGLLVYETNALDRLS